MRRTNADATLLHELIANIEAECQSTIKTYPYAAPITSATNGTRTQQLVHGIAAGRSSTIGGTAGMDTQEDLSAVQLAGPLSVAAQLSFSPLDLDHLPGLVPSGHSRSSSVIIHDSSPLLAPMDYLELDDLRPSPETLEKSAACGYYLQQHFIHLHRSRVQRMRHRHDIEMCMQQQDLDPFIRAKVRTALINQESSHLRRSRAPITKSMFTFIQQLGRGAFGEVSLVRCSEDQGIYALKAMSKHDIVERGQVTHVKAERDLLAQAENEWVVKLFYSFQDEQQLYFAMEYLPVSAYHVAESCFSLLPAHRLCLGW
jgi:hypothetical protein